VGFVIKVRYCGDRDIFIKGLIMAKGNNSKGNKEAKKPKKEKPKASATANSGAGKAGIVIAGKKAN
jgi:hypothetical protein